MARLLVLMGSGETTPTMVTPHQRMMATLGDGARIVLDTPYGFQENADELSSRTVEYFAHNVGQHVEVVSLRDAASTGPVAQQLVVDAIAAAAWVFAGPGSPSYLARQWLATDVPDALRARLTGAASGAGDEAHGDTVTVFASAAACTVGQRTIPVYELYKVGESPHWRDGLDLLRPLGLDAIVVPHFDNAEGGTHDTSCCYIGARRLRMLEDELDASTWVLGIDEHTAAVLDLDARTLRVEGRGRTVVRVRGQQLEIASGTTVAFDELLAFVGSHGVDGESGAWGVTSAGAGVSGAATGASDVAQGAADRFAEAIDRGDLLGAAEVTAALLAVLDGQTREDAVRQVTALARIAQAGLHEHRELVAPHVETLLELRRAAREERRFADADAIRDGLVAAGIEVRDGDEATAWAFTDPIDAALGASRTDG
jgi:cyanophycinase-like exopeptidase